MKEITSEWIRKAEQDFRVAIRELQQEPPESDAVCFHSQQCVEKYLKAILQENQIGFLKIHDLAILMEQCVAFFPDLQKHREEIIKISTYAVDVRYPGVDISESEASESVMMMKRIRNRIRGYFNLRDET